MKIENKGQKIKIGTIMLVIFLLIYIPSLFHWAYGKVIATDIIRKDIIEDSVNVDAFFIRDEEVLTSPFEGKYIPEVDEGEKVPVNFRVATVLKGSSEKTLDEIRKVDEDILKSQKDKSENQIIFSQDIVKLDEDISDKVKLLATVSNSGSFEKYEDIQNELDAIIKKRASVLGGLGTSDGQLNSLLSERSRLQGIVDSSTRQIVSKHPGIISYTVDGLEEDFTPSAINDLTSKTLENIKVKNFQTSGINRNVDINKPFAKIIKGIDVFIAAVMDTKNAEFINLNKGVKLRVNDVNKVVNGTVVRKSEESGKCVIVIKTDRLISETAYMRRANIDFIKNSYSGLKVPLKSLVDIDSSGTKAKIVLVKANYASIRNVVIEGKNSEYAIIDNEEPKMSKGVSLYDRYVINPRNIEEGQLIN